MEEVLYHTIFKRKSFHLFKDVGRVTREELNSIRDAFGLCKPLIPEIKVEMKIVPAEQTTCRRGQKLCILLYSEQKEGYLPNIGYIGEQLDIANIVRFAPSACNTQPWIVENSAGRLNVYRYKKPGKRGIMPADRVAYYNRIDMGIFLLFLELCLKHEGISYERTLFSDAGDEEKTLTAVYRMNARETEDGEKCSYRISSARSEC